MKGVFSRSNFVSTAFFPRVTSIHVSTHIETFKERLGPRFFSALGLKTRDGDLKVIKEVREQNGVTNHGEPIWLVNGQRLKERK